MSKGLNYGELGDNSRLTIRNRLGETVPFYCLIPRKNNKRIAPSANKNINI
jgi:hypothetical protein